MKKNFAIQILSVFMFCNLSFSAYALSSEKFISASDNIYNSQIIFTIRNITYKKNKMILYCDVVNNSDKYAEVYEDKFYLLDKNKQDYNIKLIHNPLFTGMKISPGKSKKLKLVINKNLQNFGPYVLKGSMSLGSFKLLPAINEDETIAVCFN